MNPTQTIDNSNVIGSYQYDLKNNLEIGSSSSGNPYPASNQPVNITGESLQRTPQINVPNINTDTGASSLITDVGTRTQSQIDQATKEYEALQKATGDKGNQAQQLLNQTALDLVNKKGNIITTQANQEESLVAPERKALNEINTQIANEQIALRAEQDRIRTTAQSKEQAQTETSALNDTYGRRLADLAIRQSAAQGNIEGIQKDSERKTALLLAPIDSAIDYYKTFGQNNVNNLTQKEQAQLTYLTSNLEKQKQDIKDLESAKANMIAEIAKNGGGADQSVIQAVQNAKDIASVASAGSKYVGQLDYLAKLANIEQSKASAAASYASAAKTRAEILAATAPVNAQNTADQLKFLRDTAKEAKDLAGASGRSGARRAVESWLVGSTNYTNLEAKTNTLRTNVLTLMTDPNIKKFFGPQMSEADVRLMTAAGTTLNPELNSPDQMKNEIDRLDNLLNRMQTAIKAGLTTGGGTNITAPTGEIITIID